MSSRVILTKHHVSIGQIEDAKRHMRDHQKVTTIMGKRYVIVDVQSVLAVPPSFGQQPLYNLTVELKEVGACLQSE